MQLYPLLLVIDLGVIAEDLLNLNPFYQLSLILNVRNQNLSGHSFFVQFRMGVGAGQNNLTVKTCSIHVSLNLSRRKNRNTQ